MNENDKEATTPEAEAPIPLQCAWEPAPAVAGSAFEAPLRDGWRLRVYEDGDAWRYHVYEPATDGDPHGRLVAQGFLTDQLDAQREAESAHVVIKFLRGLFGVGR